MLCVPGFTNNGEAFFVLNKIRKNHRNTKAITRLYNNSCQNMTLPFGQQLLMGL